MRKFFTAVGLLGLAAAGWAGEAAAAPVRGTTGTVVRIVVYLALPMAWGLLVEYVFERARRRRSGKAPEPGKNG